MPTADDLADRLVDTVVTALDEFAERHAPKLNVPYSFAGHRVSDDSIADLIFTLGLLDRCGVRRVAGVSCADQAAVLLNRLDPQAVQAFSSYRIGETLLHFGPSPETSRWPNSAVTTAIEAADSTGLLELVREGKTPNNFVIVAARCLAVSQRLGGSVDSEMREFADRTRELFGGTATGWINDGFGSGSQYDIYTPDMYLFAEPLADSLGSMWSDGLRKVLVDLEDLTRHGGAVVWGRSIGALGLAITIELAAVAARRGLTDNPERWLQRANQALTELNKWFPNGVIAAHQDRATMFYRGPARRLQMTFDVLGKMLQSALELRHVPHVKLGDPDEAWPPVDRLIDFSGDGTATAWSFRSGPLSFVLPLVHGWATDYLPSPRQPGMFEPPTSGPPTMLPSLYLDDRVIIPTDLPTSVTWEPGTITVEHDVWGPPNSNRADDSAVSGSRRAQYRVEGRQLVVREELHFAVDPGPITVTIPAIAERPLHVECSEPSASVIHIDTEGIAEWRSFWNELSTVHQIEIPGHTDLAFEWTVEPTMVVASTIKGHPYDKALYDPLKGIVIEHNSGPADVNLARRLSRSDILHVAWPEWFTGTDLDPTEAAIAQIKESGTKIVWTQHNLEPHFDKSDEARACYQLWAEAADGVIHHSAWGRDQALRAYSYGARTRHEVIPHGHWGPRYANITATRSEVELAEGWPSTNLRLAVVGTPRQEKLIQDVVDAVHRSRRDDIQLIIRVDKDTVIPEDPRIIAELQGTGEDRYLSRMRAFDAMIIPFKPTGMLTTGIAFDAMAIGLPVITSNWGFLDETFDGADIRYGSSVEQLTACIDSLTPRDLERSAHAVQARQRFHDWNDIATATAELFRSLTV